MNTIDSDEAQQLRNKLAISYGNRLRWYPSDQDLSRIEEFGYLGINDPKEQSALLGVKVCDYTLAGVCLPSIIASLTRGKARAHFDVQSTLMGMIRGVIEADAAQLNAIKFALTSRFGSDERAVQTSIQVAQAHDKIRLERKKVKLSKEKLALDTKAHEEKLELEITKFARDLTPQERDAMAK